MFAQLLELLKRAGLIGRKSDSEKVAGPPAEPETEEDLSQRIVLAFGGYENIADLDACMTRLRVRVADAGKVDKDRLMQLGAVGVWEMGSEIHALFGIRSDVIKSRMQAMLAERAPDEDSFGEPPAEQDGTSANASPAESIVSPADGELLDLSSVPDTFFSQRMIGDGFAVLPASGRIVSPVDGMVLTVFPGKHAVGILSEAGIEILVHIGVNTVKLKGQGFNVCVMEGQRVAAGQPILEVDLAYVKEHAASLVTPIVFTNLPEQAAVELLKTGRVRAGEPAIIRIG